MASNLEAMAPNQTAMASNPIAIPSNLIAMASNPIASNFYFCLLSTCKCCLRVCVLVIFSFCFCFSLRQLAPVAPTWGVADGIPGSLPLELSVLGLSGKRLGARTLLGTSASLLVTSALLLGARTLLGAKGIATRSKDAWTESWMEKRT